MPHNTMLKRVRAEYLEMPGLRLTLEQAQRLCGLERALCMMVLDALVDDKFLCMKPDGVYARVSDVEMSRPRAAKADLRLEQSVAKAS
jgi:hypothetical protein